MTEKSENSIPKETLHQAGHGKKEVIWLGFMSVAILLSVLRVWQLFLSFDVFALTATIIGGYPVYKETFTSLRKGRISMEVSMAIAIFASLAIGELTVSAVIVFFVLVSEFIEAYSVDKGRQTIVMLERQTPKKALVRRCGNEIDVEVNDLKVNDVVIAKDGERIPVDGFITVGSAFVNQSAITGESSIIEKVAGDWVHAGSIVENGVIEVRTKRIGTETIFGKIIKLVENAEKKKAPIQKISDRLASRLIEFALAFAVVTFLVTRDLSSTISVVVVAGACGVAAGTPLALVATMGKAAKKGAIIKGGIYLEELNRIDTVVIDKTGTLTFGEPRVTKLTAFNGFSANQVLKYAAMAEKHSTHPVARAIIKKAEEEGITFSTNYPPTSTSYKPGKGVKFEHEEVQILVGNQLLMEENYAIFPKEKEIGYLKRLDEGNSGIFVSYNKEVCGIVFVADMVRLESKRTIGGLKKMGVRTVMLTGDQKSVAQAVSNEIGIDEVYAELLPQDKVNFVENLVNKGRIVAMVGDGINDAPALARANVGIGMGAGTDVAIEEADIVLMTNDLQKILEVTILSKKAYRTIMQNFYGTVAIDGVGVALAFLGLLNPLLAAGIHITSELAFILNSAKLIN